MQCHDVDVPVIRYNFVSLSGLPDLQKEAVCGMLLAFSRKRFRGSLVDDRRHCHRERNRGFGRNHYEEQ